jgi:hypothetical protein
MIHGDARRTIYRKRKVQLIYDSPPQRPLVNL